jgi:hypothetical protein
MFGSDIGPRSAKRLGPLLFLLLATIIIFGADRVSGYGLAMAVRASDYRLSRIYAGTGGSDVLVSGNSVGNAMLIPTRVTQALHRPVFSIASHGMDAITQRAFIEDYLDHQPPPRLALLEVRPLFNAENNAPAFSTYQALSQRLRGAVRDAEGAASTWSEIFHSFRVNSPQLPAILWKTFDRDDQQTGPSNGQINAALIADWSSRKQKPHVSRMQLEALAATIADLEQRGTKVILLMAPLHPAARGDGQWIARAGQSLQTQLPGTVRYVDWSHALSADGDFEDPIHLNQHGRAELEPRIVQLLNDTLAEPGIASGR